MDAAGPLARRFWTPIFWTRGSHWHGGRLLPVECSPIACSPCSYSAGHWACASPHVQIQKDQLSAECDDLDGLHGPPHLVPEQVSISYWTVRQKTPELEAWIFTSIWICFVEGLEHDPWREYLPVA